MAARRIVPAASSLFEAALPPNPYFVPGHFLLLYVGVPASILAAIALVLLPGFLFTLLAGGTSSSTRWVIRSFGAAYVLNVTLLTGLKLFGVRISATVFLLTQLGVLLLLAALLIRRVSIGRPVRWPLAEELERRRLWWLVAIPAFAAIALLPVILWQDMNEDGLEALEIGRSLATFIIPRFPHELELSGLGNPMASVAFPVSWFVALFGPIDAAARIPLLLYLPVLYMAMLALAEWGTRRRLTFAEEGAVALALAIFVVTMGYSASYNPYSADLAAPAAFDTFVPLCLAAAILFLWEKNVGWFLLFVILGYFARPTGLLSLLLLAVSGAAFLHRADRVRSLTMIGAGIGACVVVGYLYEILLGIASEGRPIAYGGSLLNRVRFLQFLDLRRLLFLLIPTGLIPAGALFVLRPQDRHAKMLTGFILLYFLFFYLQAFVALHHFAPVMILPVVVLWRIVLNGSPRRWLRPVVYAAATLCFVLSLPRSFELLRAYRAVGASLKYGIGDYEGDYAEFRAAIDARKLLFSLFPADWEVSDPAKELVGAPTSMMRYAFVGQGKDVNYVVLPTAADAPAGFTEVTRAETDFGIDYSEGDLGGAVFVRDTLRWQRQRFSPPPTGYRSPLYDIPRETLFDFLGRPARNYSLDLRSLPVVGRLF